MKPAEEVAREVYELCRLRPPGWRDPFYGLEVDLKNIIRADRIAVLRWAAAEVDRRNGCDAGMLLRIAEQLDREIPIGEDHAQEEATEEAQEEQQKVAR